MAVIEGFGWVDDDRQGQLLSSEWGEAWPEHLRHRLDALWPGWEQAGDEERQQWLDGVIPTIGQDVADLGWVTAEQGTQLDELWEIRGNWHEWLPAELDSRWPEWRQSTADELTPWLDNVISSLVLPSEAVELTVEELVEHLEKADADDPMGLAIRQAIDNGEIEFTVEVTAASA